MKLKTLLQATFALIAMIWTTTAAAQQKYPYITIHENVITFYYDSNHLSRPGSIYVVSNTGDPKWYNTTEATEAIGVIFDSSFADHRPKTTSKWFHNCSKIKKISGIENLNTSSVVDMSYMFYKCSGLTTLDLSTFNTTNVQNMKSMFDGCYNLTSLDVSSFNTANVTI